MEPSSGSVCAGLLGKALPAPEENRRYPVRCITWNKLKKMQGGCWMSLGLRGLSLSLIVSLIGCPEPASGKSLLPRWLYFMKNVPPYVIMMNNKHRPCVIFYTGYKLPENSRLNSTWKHGDTGFEKAILGWCLFMNSFGWT